MEEREGEGDYGGPSAPPPTTMNFPPSCEVEFEVLRKLLKWGCYKVRSRCFTKRLTEESDKRDGRGAPLTNSPLFSPPAADISCGSIQIVVTGAADKRDEDMLVIDKKEEEQEQEAAEEEEEDEILRDYSPPMSEEYWIRYFKQVEESEGFDVDDFPGRQDDNLLAPIGSLDNDLYVKIGRCAVNSYNKRKKDAPIEFVRVVKIITRFNPGWWPHYVTLEGRDTGDVNKIKTYQALVEFYPELGEFVLKMFRLKPSTETPSSKGNKHPLGECCGECLRANVVQDDEAGPEHETLLPPRKKPRVENNEEQPQEHLQPQSSANSSPSNDDFNDSYDSDDHDPMSHEDIMLRDFEISLEAPVNGFASVAEAEEFWRKHYQYDDNHLDRKSLPKYTLEDFERYYEQLEDSQGFDVDYFPDMENLEFVTPIRDEEVVNNRFTEHAKLAIEFHNKEEGTQLQLRKIIKVNCLNIVCCPHAYITFEAIDAADGVHDEPKTYQARVLTIPGQMKVEEVRLKA